MATTHTSNSNLEKWRYTPLEAFRIGEFYPVDSSLSGGGRGINKENRGSNYKLPDEIGEICRFTDADAVLIFYNGDLLQKESKVPEFIHFYKENDGSQTVDMNLTSPSNSKCPSRIAIVHIYGNLLGVESQFEFRVQPRQLYKIKETSSVEIVESHLAVNSIRFHVANRSQFSVGANACVTFAQTFWLGEEAVATNEVAATLDESAKLRQLSFNVGSALIRNDIQIDLSGKGADCRLDALVLATGRHHVDTYSRVRHMKSETKSEQLIKSVLNEQARVVFTGHLQIAEDAQKSDANQLSQSLLLSRGAEADTRPQLEVAADDVKAAHGATIGQLDEKELFYLMSRGISRSEARHALALAYQRELLERLPAGFMSGHVSVLHSRLPADFSADFGSEASDV